MKHLCSLLFFCLLFTGNTEGRSTRYYSALPTITGATELRAHRIRQDVFDAVIRLAPEYGGGYAITEDSAKVFATNIDDVLARREGAECAGIIGKRVDAEAVLTFAYTLETDTNTLPHTVTYHITYRRFARKDGRFLLGHSVSASLPSRIALDVTDALVKALLEGTAPSLSRYTNGIYATGTYFQRPDFIPPKEENATARIPTMNRMRKGAPLYPLTNTNATQTPSYTTVERAVMEGDAALTTVPTHARMLYERALSNAGTGKADNALVKRVYRAECAVVTQYFAFGERAEREGFFRTARSYYTKAHALAVRNGLPFTGQAETRYTRTYANEVRTMLREGDAILQKGELRFARNAYNEALKRYQMVFALDDDTENVFNEVKARFFYYSYVEMMRLFENAERAHEKGNALLAATLYSNAVLRARACRFFHDKDCTNKAGNARTLFSRAYETCRKERDAYPLRLARSVRMRIEGEEAFLARYQERGETNLAHQRIARFKEVIHAALPLLPTDAKKDAYAFLQTHNAQEPLRLVASVARDGDEMKAQTTTTKRHIFLSCGTLLPVYDEHLSRYCDEMRTDGNPFALKSVHVAERTTLTAGGVSLPFRAHTILFFHPNGAVYEGMLDEDTPIPTQEGTRIFPKGQTLSFYANGILKEGAPEREYTNQTKEGNYIFSGEKGLTFYATGAIAEGTLVHKARVTTPYTRLHIPASARVRLSPHGALSCVYDALPKTLRIEETRITCDTNEGSLSFYETGIPERLILAEPVTYQMQATRIRFAKGTPLTFHPNGIIDEGTLAEETVWQTRTTTFTLAKGSGVEFDTNGTLAKGMLARAVAMNGVSLPAGTDVFLKSNTLTLAFIYRTVAFTHEDCSTAFRANTTIAFSDDGRVREGILATNTWMPFETTHLLVQGHVTFHTNGALATCTLVKEARFRSYGASHDDVVCATKGSVLRFSPHGRVTSLRLAEPRRLTLPSGTFALAKESVIRFSRQGRVTHVRLAGDTVLPRAAGDIPLPSGTWLTFRRGTVSGALLAENTLVSFGKEDIAFHAGSWLHFHANGKVKEGVIAYDHPYTIEGNTSNITLLRERTIVFDNEGAITAFNIRLDSDAHLRSKALAKTMETYVGGSVFSFAKWHVVDYHQNGAVASGVLADDTPVMIDGTLLHLKGGKRVFFYESGMVKKGTLAEETRLTRNGYGYTLAQADAPPRDPLFTQQPAPPPPGMSSESHDTALYFAKGTTLSFHETGGISEGELAGPYTFVYRGVPVTFTSSLSLTTEGAIAAGDLAECVTLPVLDTAVEFARFLAFHETGELQRGGLVNDIDLTVNGTKTRFTGWLAFHTNGALAVACLKNAASFTLGTNTVSFPPYTWLRFYSTGAISEAKANTTIFLPTTVGTLPCKADAWVSFHSNGTLAQGLLGETTSISLDEQVIALTEGEGVVFNPSGTLSLYDARFYENRTLSEGTLARESAYTVCGVVVRFAKGERIMFHRGGGVKQGILATRKTFPFMNETLSFNAGRLVFFEEDGRIMP